MTFKKTNLQKEPEIINIGEAITYQEDSIVSKEIIKEKTGTITLFSFDKGQRLSEHTAPFDAFIYVFDGEAEIIILGKTYQLKTGNMIMIPAHKPHALEAKKRFKMMLIMIKK